MPLNQPVRSGQGTGRTVIYPTRSNAELKLAGEESGGDWADRRMATARGRRVAAHPHREDETGYALDDAITAYVGDQQIEVAAESYATLPKNVPPA